MAESNLAVTEAPRLRKDLGPRFFDWSRPHRPWWYSSYCVIRVSSGGSPTT